MSSNNEENKENIESADKPDSSAKTDTNNKSTRKTRMSKRDKNDPSRFQGGGTNFKAKLIGIEPVAEARGDKMCQEAMVKVKTAVKSSGEHKQKMVINVSLEGLKLMDEKSGTTLHHHAVHKISFISRDMSDNRAFGYVYGGGDGRHDFFGIKTEKAAENLVLTLRDLFQVVFELKKKEMEAAKRRKESTESSPQQQQLQHEVSSPTPSTASDQTADNLANDSNTSAVHNGPTTSATAAPPSAAGFGDPGTIQGAAAVGNLLDLESELAFIQEGINQMDALPPQPNTPGSVGGWGAEDPWGKGSFTTPTSPPSSSSSGLTGTSRPDVSASPAPASASAFPVNFNDAFQSPQSDPFNQGPAPIPPPRQNSSSPAANPFGGSGGSDMFHRPSPQQSPGPAVFNRPSPQQSPAPGGMGLGMRPSPQASPGPAVFRPSPQPSPQPSAAATWGAGAQQAFPPAQAFPPTAPQQQNFPQAQAFPVRQSPAQQSFDSSPFPPPQQAFPPAQPQQDMFGASPFGGAAMQATATSTPNNQGSPQLQQQNLRQQQQPSPFGGGAAVKVASDPFKDDPFFSSSTAPAAPAATSTLDKYAVFSDSLSQPSSVFGDSSGGGGGVSVFGGGSGSGSVFDSTATNGATSMTPAATTGGSTMNNAFRATSPGSTSTASASPGPTPPQRNASSENVFQDLDVLGGGGSKKEFVDKAEFFKQPPKPTLGQIGGGGGGARATPPPGMMETHTQGPQSVFTPPGMNPTPDPFGSGPVNVSDTFNASFANNQSLEGKTHDPFDTSNIVLGPKVSGPFDTSHLKPKQAESPPIQRSAKPNELAFSTPNKNGAFEDSFTLPSPEAPPPPLPQEAKIEDSPAPMPPPRPTFARAATIDMTSSTLPLERESLRSRFNRQATVDVVGEGAPVIPPRPADAHPPALPPRPGTSASITSNASSPGGTRRSSCTTPPLPPRPLSAFPATTDSFDRHPSPQLTGGSAPSSHEPSPHHVPTAGTVSRARPRPRPRTPGSSTSTATGSLTLTRLTEQPSATEHAQDTFVRDTQVRQSDNIQLTARRLANKTLVRNQSEPVFNSTQPDGFRDSFRASPADLAGSSAAGGGAGPADASFPVNFPSTLPPDACSARSQTPSEHSMDTDRVSESLTFDSARSHTDSPAFHSRSDPFPHDFDPFGDEQPKDPFSESPEEEVFTTKAITVDPDPFADDPFANDPFENSRPKSGCSLDTSSQYSDCRSTHESHSHSNSDSQAEAHNALTLPKEALSHWESFSERPTPTDAPDKSIVDKLAASSSESKDDALNTNGLTSNNTAATATAGEMRRDPFGSLDPLTSVDIKAKLQIKENLAIKEELQWAFSNKNQSPAPASGAPAPDESPRNWPASVSETNQVEADSTVVSSVAQSNQSFPPPASAIGPSGHVSSSTHQSQTAMAEAPSAHAPAPQNEAWASDDAFYSSSHQQPFAAVNGGAAMMQGGIMSQQQQQQFPSSAVAPSMAFTSGAPTPMQQQMAPAMPPRQQSVGNPFAPNNQWAQ